MTFVSQTPVRRNGHAVPMVLALALAGLLCVLHLRLFGQSWPLMWLPVAVVALWPSRVGPALSGVVLCAAGLWVDFVTLGAPGQWSIAFLAVYVALRPDLRPPPQGFVSALARVAAALLVAAVMVTATGRLVYGSWPDVAALGRGVATAMLLSPLVIAARAGVARSLSGDDS